MAHGFFLVMGGFALHGEQGTALRILEYLELEKLSGTGKIAWPTQCIVRGVYGLRLSELEVATLAFATISGVTYYLWWPKPLDVRGSVPVYLLPHSNKVCVDSNSPVSEEIQIQRQPLIVIPNPKLNPREPNFTITRTPKFTRT